MEVITPLTGALSCPQAPHSHLPPIHPSAGPCVSSGNVIGLSRHRGACGFTPYYALALGLQGEWTRRYYIYNPLPLRLCCSDDKSCLTFQPHGLQHSRLPCPLLSQSLLKLVSIESVMPSNHLILCHPLLLLPSIFPSIRVFSYESAFHIKWPKYWSFSFSISPPNEYLVLISFRID